MGNIAHDMALGSGQIHICQSVGHDLVGAAMEYAGQVSQMFQIKHLQINVASYVLF